MDQLVVMIAKMSDFDKTEGQTEIWRCAMPEIDLRGIRGQPYLDGLEQTVMRVGWETMRTLLVEQWRLTDRMLVERFRQEQPGAILSDGYAALKVASRLGIVHLPRQVCYLADDQRHQLPGNVALPEHAGQVTTRGLQEWACLLPHDLSFASAQRFLGWMTQDAAVLSETQIRRWVGSHGQRIRQAEQAETAALLKCPDLAGWQAQLSPAHTPRRAAGWPAELQAAVDAALEQPDPRPPQGISQADWERVLEVRRTEADWQAEDLRHLGPQVGADQIIASTDDVEVRRPQQRRFLQLRTAYVRTAQGYRYLSGTGVAVLQQLYLLLVLCGGGVRAKVTLLGDGARWIADFFQQRMARWSGVELLIDWYHCRKRCYDLTCLICRGRKAKADLLGCLLHQLWHGQVQIALEILQVYRPQAKNLEKLDELIAYLENRRAYLPDYHQRRKQRQYIGSAHTEKANDLIVARRQKHQGMHWSETTSDALAALRTLMLNGGWDLYWQHQHVLPLAVPNAT